MKEIRRLTPYEGRVKAFGDYVVKVAERFEGDEAYMILALEEKLTASSLTSRGDERKRLQTEIDRSVEDLKALNNPKVNLALSDIGSAFVRYTVI